jgi:hypothetical protein
MSLLQATRGYSDLSLLPQLLGKWPIKAPNQRVDFPLCGASVACVALSSWFELNTISN